MKKIIFTLVAFVGLFVSLIFGFDSNASAFNQRLYYDTRQFQDGLTVFSDSRYMSYGSKAVTDLINLNSQNGNSSYVGVTFTYSSAIAPENYNFEYAFSASLDLSKSYFDLSEMSNNEKLYILVYESHNSEEYSFSRTDFSFNYNHDVDLVETGFNNYVDSYDVQYIQPILKSYSFVIFDISAYVSNLNVINGNAGYLSFYSRYRMIYDTVYDFNDNESLSFNYVVFSSLVQPVITTPIVRSAVNYIERKFPEDTFAYVDLTYNAQPKDFLSIYYKDPYNKGFELGKKQGYADGYNKGYEEGYQKGLEYYSQPQFKYGNLYDSSWGYKYKVNNTSYSSFVDMGKIPEVAYAEYGINLNTLFSMANEEHSLAGSFEIYVKPPKNIIGNQNYTILNYSFNKWYIYSFGAMLDDNFVYTGNIPIVPLDPDLPIVGSRSYSFDGEVNVLVFNSFYDNTNDYGYLTNLSGIDASILESVGIDNYNKGFNQGQKQGYEEGFTTGRSEGYTIGFNDGYASSSGSGNSLVGMIYAIVDAPFKVLKDSMNFNFLGINVADFIFSALTMIIVIKIFKFVFGK